MSDDTPVRPREPAKWWVVGGLVALVAAGAAVQAWREGRKPAPPPPLHARYRMGQRWRVVARPHESRATATVLELEPSERDGVLVHVQVDGIQLRTPGGTLERIGHLPLTAAALDASVVDLEADYSPPPGDYRAALDKWRAGYQEGRWPAITTSVRDGVDLTELSMNR